MEKRRKYCSWLKVILLPFSCVADAEEFLAGCLIAVGEDAVHVMAVVLFVVVYGVV